MLIISAYGTCSHFTLKSKRLFITLILFFSKNLKITLGILWQQCQTGAWAWSVINTDDNSINTCWHNTSVPVMQLYCPKTGQSNAFADLHLFDVDASLFQVLLSCSVTGGLYRDITIVLLLWHINMIIWLLKNKRRSKISAYESVFFEYKRMRLFLSVYSNNFLTPSPPSYNSKKCWNMTHGIVKLMYLSRKILFKVLYWLELLVAGKPKFDHQSHFMS